MVILYIAIGAAGLLASLPAWLLALRRIRALERRADEHEAVVERLVRGRHRPPDDDGDDGRRKRHLRVVGLWLPIVGALGWIARSWRRWPARWSVATMAAAVAGIVAIGLIPHGVPDTPSATPPASVAPTTLTTLTIGPTPSRRRRVPVRTATGTTPGTSQRIEPDTQPPTVPPASTTTTPRTEPTGPVTSTGPPPSGPPTTSTPPAPTPPPSCVLACLSLQLHLPILDGLPGLLGLD